MRRYATFALAMALVLGIALMSGCGRRADVGTGTDDYSFDDVTSVDLDLAVGEVTYQTGDQFAVTVERVNYPEVVVEENGGVLTITEVPGMGSIGGVPVCKVDITVPVDAELDELEFEVAAGNMLVTDVNAGRVGLTVNAGSITLEGVTTEEAQLEADAGTIAVSGFAGLQDANISLEVSAGEVVFLGSSQGGAFEQAGSGATLTAEVAAGEIVVQE